MFEFFNSWLTNLWVVIAFLVVGFVLLVKGADWLVEGASGLAKRIGVSNLIIGLTVVAFGTSMPEFVVNIISSAEGNSELAITNVLGSNAINIFVILGLTALIWPVSCKPQARKVDVPVAFGASLLVLFFATFTHPKHLTWSNLTELSFTDGSGDYISGIGGSVLCACFVFYMFFLFKQSKKNPDENDDFEPVKVWKAVLLIVLGLVGLTIGGELIVKSATEMAHRFGVSDAVIGLTIVALGTSLPELATSCVAAAKHNSDLALGNCVGSCIFNVFFVLGVSSLIHPLAGYPGLWIDALMAMAGHALVFIFVQDSRKKHINRYEGGALLLCYAAYLTYRLMAI